MTKKMKIILGVVVAAGLLAGTISYKMPGAPRTNRADVAAVMLDQLNNKSSYKQKLIMCSK